MNEAIQGPISTYSNPFAVLLTGGVGGARGARSLAHVLADDQLLIVGNVGDVAPVVEATHDAIHNGRLSCAPRSDEYRHELPILVFTGFKHHSSDAHQREVIGR